MFFSLFPDFCRLGGDGTAFWVYDSRVPLIRKQRRVKFSTTLFCPLPPLWSSTTYYLVLYLTTEYKYSYCCFLNFLFSSFGFFTLPSLSMNR